MATSPFTYIDGFYVAKVTSFGKYFICFHYNPKINVCQVKKS